MNFIGLVPGSGTDSELDSNGNYEVKTLASPLSMELLLSLPIIDETKVLVLVVEVLYLK